LVELVKSGIEGLDAMLFGGFPKGNQVMIGGGPGAGKTLMSFEYLYHGAKEGERGIFFALEEEPERVIQNIKAAFPNFGDIDELIGSGMITVHGKDLLQEIVNKYEQTGLEFGKVVAEMEETLVKSGASRAVVDSSAAFELLIKDPVVYRRSMWSLAANFRRLGVTAMLVSEIPDPDRKKLVFKTEHFIFDGMILLYQSGEESRRVYTLEIIKMRGYKHSFVTAPYDITPDGFSVMAPELITR
jgi:circadian clock protein KaiC